MPGNFPGKDELIGALLQQYFADAFADLTALRDSSGPLQPGWRHRSRGELPSWKLTRRTSAPAMSSSRLHHARSSVREVLRDYYCRFRAALAALSEQAAANGEAIRIRAPELATALVALFEGLTLLWMVEPEGVNLRQVTERALEGLLVNSTCG